MYAQYASVQTHIIQRKTNNDVIEGNCGMMVEVVHFMPIIKLQE